MTHKSLLLAVLAKAKTVTTAIGSTAVTMLFTKNQHLMYSAARVKTASGSAPILSCNKQAKVNQFSQTSCSCLWLLYKHAHYFSPGIPCLLKYLLALVGAVRNFPRARGIVRYLMYVDTDLRATTVRTLGTKYAATVSGCTVMKQEVSTASMQLSSPDELFNNVPWECDERMHARFQDNNAGPQPKWVYLLVTLLHTGNLSGMCLAARPQQLMPLLKCVTQSRCFMAEQWNA